MSTAKRTLRNWKGGAWGAALAVIIGLFEPAAPWLANLSYDLPFRVRPEVKRDEAVIIYMNDKSYDELKQDRNGIWDRELHAELIRRLTEYRARAIVFDIWFEETNIHDSVFLNAITNAGIPVIVGATITETWDHGPQIQRKEPFDQLAESTVWGYSEKGDKGAILRKHYLGTTADNGVFVPSLALRAVELASPKSVPVAGPGRWINYYGPQGTITSKGYSDIISNHIPAEVFTDKVCFVGAFPPQIPPSFAGFRLDTWPTPYGEAPGVDVNATVYLNLIHGDWLREVPVSVQRLLVLGMGLLFGAGLTLFRPTTATGLGIGGIVAVTATACVLMATQHLWFSWLVVVVVQIPISIGWSVLVNTKRLAQEKTALQTQLVAAQTAMQELATGEGMATRVEGETWSERADTAAEKALAVISGTAPDGQPVIPDHDLVRRVGKGAYGEVWLARNVIGTFHAVKILKREDFESDEPFDREFRGIQKFMPISRSHPGLVQILHAGRNQQLGYMYYIMEVGDDEKTGQTIYPDTYVPKNLAKEIKKRRHFPASECLELSLQLTAALEYLHQQNLIHRDIKPANIIFVRGAPKFADIGLVTDIAPAGREATFLGTVGYIPPEGPGTPASDVFSLGKVLYEASMGLGVQQYPELPSTMIERPDLQVFFQLNQIILKACQEDRSQRYQSAAEMHAELTKLQTAVGLERKA